MPRRTVPPKLWSRIEKNLPPRTVSIRGGRPALPNREALEGILFVLRHNILWQELPPELGSGSGMTCFRRLRDWQRDGTWRRIERMLKRELPNASAIDWPRAWKTRSP